MKEMVERWVILAGILALMLPVAAPAFAQESPQSEAVSAEEVSATGVLKAGLPADVVGDGTHSIVDEATNTLYALRGAGVDLAAYVDRPVTVYGTLTPGEDFPGAGGVASGTLPSIDVTRVEPTDGTASPSPSPSFPITVDECVSLSAGADSLTGDPAASFQGGSLLAQKTAFCQSLAYRGIQNGASTFDQAFSLADTNADGVIDQSEFEAYFQTSAVTPSPIGNGTPQSGIPTPGTDSSVDVAANDQYGNQYGNADTGGDSTGGGSAGGTLSSGISALLPDTGGAPLLGLIAGALLVVGGLVVRKVFR